MEFNIVNYLMVIYGIVFLYHVWLMVTSKKMIAYGKSLTNIQAHVVLFIIITLTSLIWPVFAINKLRSKDK